MFKLVVLFALVAVAVAKPSLYHGAIQVATPIVAKSYLAPAAVSSTYREDIISKPAVAYAAAPAYAYAAAPAYVYATSVVAEQPKPVATVVVARNEVAPAAVSHTYREDVISKPAALAYATAPAYSYAAPAYGYATPAVAKDVVYEHAAVATPIAKTLVAPSAVSHTYREDVFSKPASIAQAVPVVAQYEASAVPVVAASKSVAVPIVAKTVVSPAAVSHTYREDTISKSAAVVVASPVVQKTVAYAHPVAYSAHAW